MSAKKSGNVTFREYNCIECSEIDDITMVQCDECDLWAHFRCVGVGPEIENSNWSCRLCDTTFNGLSLSDKKHVDASVGTEADHTCHDSSVGATAQVNYDDSSVAVAADVDAQTNCVALPVISGAHSRDVNTTIGTESSLSDDAKLVKKDSDMPVAHLRLADKETFEFYTTKLSMFGGSDMNETVREIGLQLIADSVLKNYSYLGRRGKYRFKDFDNLTRLVVASTIASIDRKHFEIHGQLTVRNNGEAKKLHTDVENYFTKEYIRQADVRYKRSLK